MSEYKFQADIKKFDPNTNRYNGENALFLADCAKLVYENKKDISTIMKTQLGFDKFEFFSGNSTQAFIAGNDKMIVIAFRGTEGKISDAITDAKFKPKDGPIDGDKPLGKVHRGFHGALHEVWDGDLKDKKNMRLVIDKFQDNNQSLWFCGHSLGAALAILAAIEYKLKANDPDAVNGIYTIGQPRVGNFTFAKGFDQRLAEKCFRFVNNSDIVTRLPPPGIILKYTHVGKQLYLDRQGKLHDSIPWWKKTMDTVRGYWNNFGELGLDSLEDHKSENYVRLIKDNRAENTKWS